MKKTPLSAHHDASALTFLQPSVIFMTATFPLVWLRGRRFSGAPLQSRISQSFICILSFSHAKSIPFPHIAPFLPSLCHNVTHVSLLFQLPPFFPPSLPVFSQWFPLAQTHQRHVCISLASRLLWRALCQGQVPSGRGEELHGKHVVPYLTRRAWKN